MAKKKNWYATHDIISIINPRIVWKQLNISLPNFILFSTMFLSILGLNYRALIDKLFQYSIFKVQQIFNISS